MYNCSQLNSIAYALTFETNCKYNWHSLNTLNKVSFNFLTLVLFNGIWNSGRIKKVYVKDEMVHPALPKKKIIHSSDTPANLILSWNLLQLENLTIYPWGFLTINKNAHKSGQRKDAAKHLQNSKPCSSIYHVNLLIE